MKIAIITGVGISESSGIPTYRGDNGIYTVDPNLQYLMSRTGYDIEPGLTLCQIKIFSDLCRSKDPNIAHVALAELERHHTCTIYTTNIDGLHQRAGSSNVVEIHGTCHKFKCTTCSQIYDVSLTSPIICLRCNKLLEPMATLFGDELAADVIDRIEAIDCDLLMIIGSSIEFPYIYEIVQKSLDNNQIQIIEINKYPTSISDQVHRFIQEDCAIAIPELLYELY